jgi:secondary thiamine-phosphate synthase enzyme
MVIATRTIQLNTKGNGEAQDITAKVANEIIDSGISNGTITIFTASSTSALTTIEYEAGVIKDLQRLLDEIIDPDRSYAHNSRWGDGNGHSHVRASLLGADITIPIVNRNMTLGTWQQIIFVDFDIRPRRRELVLQIMGDC